MEEKNYLLNAKAKNDHRLKKNSQFQYIYRKGVRSSVTNFTLYIVKSKFNNSKIGYSISKKVERRGREIFLDADLKKLLD